MNWILTIAHNALLLTRNAVATFLAQDIEGGVKLLVINNASSDNTVQWLTSIASKDDRIHTMHFSDQRSVAECWNRGLAWIFSQGADRALVVNNDVEIGPETFGYLSAVLNPDSFHRAQFVTCVSVNNREQNIHPAMEWSYHVREHPDFSCFMLHKSVIDRVGWFDERYLIAYGEDCDYHVRMHRAGIKALCFDIPFLHHGASTMKQSSPEEQRRIGEQAERNRQLFFETYGERIGTPGYNNLFTPESFGSQIQPIAPSHLMR